VDGSSAFEDERCGSRVGMHPNWECDDAVCNNILNIIIERASVASFEFERRRTRMMERMAGRSNKGW
jgi:hypothetical protein